MSTSPTRYYASRPSSRSASRAGSRPTSPPSTAEVRSQAVAKLKRAASLPRTPDGRRPSQGTQIAQTPVTQPAYQVDNSLLSYQAGPAGLIDSPTHDGSQEVLTPSPVAPQFHHEPAFPAAAAMQRTASAASSFHEPSSTQMGFSPSASSQYQVGGSPVVLGTPTPDWSAMQLAQSYLPSLSPAGLSPSPFQQQAGPSSGRNTPSPLPSLGELRTLQRSNSNAARAKAMSKLTGGNSTASGHDDTALRNLPIHISLQRSGTVGGHPRGPELESPLTKPVDHGVEEIAASSSSDPKPRLQRSFTVSSSNMGEERRSAVGRRMVERLAERRAARKKEEEEVRRLWEERRRTSASGDEHESASNSDNLAIRSPIVPPQSNHLLRTGVETLAAERPVSGVTMQSTTEPFEYESHLRRSLSSRTARGVEGAVVEPVPNIILPDQAEEEDVNHVEQLHLSSGLQHLISQDVQDEPLLPPQPKYATPTRHIPHSSTSTITTLQGSQSPGSSSTLSGLDSMMFVMGGTGGLLHTDPRGSGRQGEGNWPSEVDGGSDWGTPARDLHQATFADSPVIPSPSPSGHARLSAVEGGSGSGPSNGQLSPPSRHSSQTDSGMSWEEVGGREDQEARVPTDKAYHSKSGSISAKIGRTMRSMRKRSQSRSSATSSPPTSPRQVATDNLHTGVTSFSRRESESSMSPSQSSVSRSLSRNEHTARHQPSISSLAPSAVGQPDSSANNMLIQHQLANDPSQVSFLPRANLSDPRVLNSKLSPFPGITQFEARKMRAEGTLAPGDMPKLVHQLSDSIVPSQQRVTPSGVGADSIYALPLPAAQTDESRRSSLDSTSKRSWLAKAFGQQTSPRSSGSTSRKGSVSDVDHDSRKPGRKLSREGSSTPDPFAAPPPPSLKPSRHRSASPSVSVVPEDSEEGNRLTRFTASNRGEVRSPVPEEDEPQVLDTGLPSKSMDVLSRMDEVLALAPDDPERPEMLDDPPRKLLISTQVLQVVNVHTVKDRYLFLFNDILVIAKPIITHGLTATLDMKYVVKSVVSLDKLAVSGFTDEPTVEPERHPVVINFIQRFSQDPAAACKYLVEKSSPKVDPITLASLIFKTPELDKTQIGHLLASHEVLMKAFIDRFHFTGVRIDAALRMFLLSLRLPTESTSCEALLLGFAHRYLEANQKVVAYDRELAADLVLAIMQFNDALYGTFGFALPNHAITQETFISAFQSKDPRRLVPNGLLSDIYTSIRSTQLVQALSSQETHLGRAVVITPRRIPSKLTYHVWSERISINIPAPDPLFTIKLLGEGLEFDPPVLDFSNSTEASFRVRGIALGTKSLLFDRIGDNAALYGSLGNTHHFIVERAFMRHTFHVAFVSHTGLKRKYCFSVNDAEMRRRWGAKLEQQIQMAKEVKSRPAIDRQQEIRQTAEAVSLQVLRDALIPPEGKSTSASNTNINSSAGPTSNGHTLQTRSGPPRLATPIGEKDRGRSGSVSVVYAQHAAKEEAGLGPLQATRGGNVGDKQSGMMEVQTGKELVLLCRQNSLLPGLLELLQAGKDNGHVINGDGNEDRRGLIVPTKSESIRANGRGTKV